MAIINFNATLTKDVETIKEGVYKLTFAENKGYGEKQETNFWEVISNKDKTPDGLLPHLKAGRMLHVTAEISIKKM